MTNLKTDTSEKTTNGNGQFQKGTIRTMGTLSKKHMEKYNFKKDKLKT